MDEYYRLLQSLPPALRAPLEKLDIHYAPYVQEIRLRLGQPVLFTMQGRLCPAAKFLPGARLPTVLDAEALRDCFLQLCRRSVYAYEDELKRGYFTVQGGCRIGVAGCRGPGGFSAVTSLNLRIARWLTCPLPSELEAYIATPAGGLLLAGPPGSGKTTLLKISAGLLTPTAGSVLVNKTPVGVYTKAVTSYLPDRMALPTEFTAADAVSLYNDFFSDFDKVKADAMLADLRIQAHDKIGAMSKGTQEKMQLCLTMSRAAKLYLLDEPLGGVDPAARDYILQTILHNYSEDAALVLSTHLIGDIEKVLDEVIFLQNGKVLRQAAVDELREETGMSVDAYFREVYKC